MPLPEGLEVKDLPVVEGPGVAEKVLLEGFKIEKQDDDSWCWSAVALSIHNFYGGGMFHLQCRLVTETLRSHGYPGIVCCPKDTNEDCDIRFDTNLALDKAGNWLRAVEGSLPFDDITREIFDSKKGRPIACRTIGSNNYGGHVVALIGWERKSDGVQWVHFRDPDGPEDGSLPYDEFLYDGERTWWATCLTKSHKV